MWKPESRVINHFYHILAFIIAYVYTFTEIFISSYRFELLSIVLLLQPTGPHLTLFTVTSNELSHLLSGSILICPSVLKDSLVRHRIFCWQCFSLLAVWIYQPIVFYPPKILMRNMLMLLLRSLPLYVRNCLSLAAFKILLVFWQFHYNVSGYGCFEFSLELTEIHVVYQTWEVWAIMCSNNLCLFLSSPLGTPTV